MISSERLVKIALVTNQLSGLATTSGSGYGQPTDEARLSDLEAENKALKQTLSDNELKLKLLEQKMVLLSQRMDQNVPMTARKAEPGILKTISLWFSNLFNRNASTTAAMK